MVVFICNHCGESLKKQVVDKHAWKCKREIDVSCMDCLKDFPGKSYDDHTSCITEAEKYSGKDYVPKPNANKGAKKQESWIATVRSITERKGRLLPSGMTAVFDVIQRNDNIPKKMKGFMNFFQNSAKHIRKNDVEAAWALIEEEVNKSKQEQQRTPSNTLQQPTVLPAPEHKGKELQNGAANKRKAEEDKSVHPKSKKLKSKDSDTNGSSGKQTNEVDAPPKHIEGDENGSSKKFHWNEVIRDLLISKNKQMKLTKLKKKVLKKYRLHGADCEEQLIDGKFEKRFNKKLQKANLLIENDTVRLLD